MKHSIKFPLALAAVPIISFLTQLVFSSASGDLSAFFHHYTVVYIDFVFVPLNYLIWQNINWNKGKRIFVFSMIAFTLSCAVHYSWTLSGIDGGHMIQENGFVNPAGWVHIIFSAFEFCLMLLFLFDYKQSTKKVLFLIIVFILLYFISSLISSYYIHNTFLFEDILRVGLACVVFVIYYWYRSKPVK